MLEVKHRRRAGAADTLSMRKAFPGRPAVLATREDLVSLDEYVLGPPRWFCGRSAEAPGAYF